MKLAFDSWVVQPGKQDLLTRLDITGPQTLFDDSRIVIWRDLPERQNGTLDFTRDDGSPGRLHIKRDKHTHRNPVAIESTGVRLLHAAGIRSIPLVAYGYLPDGRTCLVTEQLYGHRSADRLIEEGKTFDDFLESSAAICAALHNANLHHRDLYLNHFYVDTKDLSSVALIDAARVKPLPWFLRSRWIVKDVAQFWFSTFNYTDDAGREKWFEAYCRNSTRDIAKLKPMIAVKANWIKRHDEKLRQRVPTRNVRLPTEM
jgi:Lipopolysaccharide kinase (Kdo/WaaP) family